MPGSEKKASSHSFEYDLVVIGGGSGGIQAARRSADLGAKVAVLDYVKPSPQNTTWGIGGTCLNVGCIPKKLMHTAALIGDRMVDSIDYGWTHHGKPDDYGLTDAAKKQFLEGRSSNFSWQTLVSNVQDHIRSSNFKYRVDLRGKGINYINALGKLVDPHTVETTDKKGNKGQVTADKIIIAVGGRPAYPDIPGALEYAISSDDLFSLKRSPGKTLVIGASYVALECAGFLNGLGFDTTVMIRSIPLRGFDRACANKIMDHMISHGTKVLQPCSPLRIDKLEKDGGKLRVSFTNNETKEEGSDLFDTVLLAVGRHPETKHLGLENAGVEISPKTGKIIVNDVEQTTTPNIYAIGDVIENGLELTPVAIQAGKLLAERLFAGATKKMDYINVPTTVFTPLEYGSVGLSEEAAKEKYGEDELIIYYKNFNVLEYTVPHRDEQAYIKLICLKNENERVIGFHYCGPSAGEMTQAVAIAMKLGATKEHFDDTIGIHPTCAETMTTLVFGETEDTGC